MVSNLKNSEIRSFRLRYKVKKLISFFENKNKFGIFLFYNSAKPSERLLVKESFNKIKDFELNLISKKVSKLTLQKKDWTFVKNLFEGNILWLNVKSETDDKNLILKQVVMNPAFTTRLVYLNDNFYRTNTIKKFLEIPSQNKDKKIMVSLIRNVLFQHTTLNMLMKQSTNYKK